MRIMCVAGARPNFMKVKPVLDALDAGGAETILVHTGQHYDASMSAVFFAELGLRAPDIELGVGSGTHAAQTGFVMMTLEPVVRRERPDVVVVVGDTNSTLGAALAATKSGALVAHVEAGLRSHDWTMPEEVNRVVVDRVSDYLFAPSADAVDNLQAEGYRPEQVHLVGNVMIDTLLLHLDRARAGDVPARFGLTPGGYGVVTLHRPANVDDEAALKGIVEALGDIATTLPLLFPVHPRARPLVDVVGLPDGVIATEPLGYHDFIALEADAALVLTDSGGVQEETTVLGVPCLTLRTTTERPITVSLGTNRVVGRRPDDIVRAAQGALADRRPSRAIPDLWDGHAAERIAATLLAAGDPLDHPRPTSQHRTGEP